MNEFLAFRIGVDTTRREATSALPSAPVVPHREPRRPVASGRATVASGLHRLAWWVEPRPRAVAVGC